MIEDVPGVASIIASVPVVGVLVWVISRLDQQIRELKLELREVRKELYDTLSDHASLRGTIMHLESRLGMKMHPDDPRRDE